MSSRPAFGVPTIRRAAQKRADATSIRDAAAEIPMSYTAFRHFLRGGKPHPETLTKLVRWYADHREGTPAISGQDVRAAVELLLAYMDEGGTPKATARRRAEILNLLAGSENK